MCGSSLVSLVGRMCGVARVRSKGRHAPGNVAHASDGFRVTGAKKHMTLASNTELEAVGFSMWSFQSAMGLKNMSLFLFATLCNCYRTCAKQKILNAWNVLKGMKDLLWRDVSLKRGFSKQVQD